MKIVDARGLSCPEPVVLAGKAAKEGESFTVFVSRLVQAENVQRRVERAGFLSEIVQDDGFVRVEATVGQGCKAVEANQTGTLVVKVPQDSFGSGGNKELEDVLCRAFFHTLTEMDHTLPTDIVFYDRGVFLTIEESSVYEDLRQLERKGIRLLVCGTCLDHYGLMDKTRVGVVSNMLEIVEVLGSAERQYSI